MLILLVHGLALRTTALVNLLLFQVYTEFFLLCFIFPESLHFSFKCLSFCKLSLSITVFMSPNYYCIQRHGISLLSNHCLLLCIVKCLGIGANEIMYSWRSVFKSAPCISDCKSLVISGPVLSPAASIKLPERLVHNKCFLNEQLTNPCHANADQQT